MNQADRDGALADGGCDPFDRAVPDVADGEHAGQGGLQERWSPLLLPVVAGIGAGEDVAPVVAGDGAGQPFGEWLGADQDEQASGWGALNRPGDDHGAAAYLGPVPQRQDT